MINEEVIEILDFLSIDYYPNASERTIKGAHGLAYGRYGCSVCKRKFPAKSNFCPDCGADMRGEEE